MVNFLQWYFACFHRISIGFSSGLYSVKNRRISRGSKEPFVDLFLVNIVVNRRIVEDDNDRLSIDVQGRQSVNELYHLRALDRRVVKGMNSVLAA